jgi:hypothetical protein
MKVREPSQANEPVLLTSGSLSSRRFCGLGSELRSQILKWEVFLGARKYSKTKIPIPLAHLYRSLQWAVDELKAMSREIEDTNKLTFGLLGAQ